MDDEQDLGDTYDYISDKRKRDADDDGVEGENMGDDMYGNMSDNESETGSEVTGKGGRSSNADGRHQKTLSKADKRAHHNALERKRRDHIKDSFTVLRDSIPSLSGEKVTASRAQILNKATDYIQYIRKKNAAHQAEMEDLKKQNALLAQQGMALGISFN